MVPFQAQKSRVEREGISLAGLFLVTVQRSCLRFTVPETIYSAYDFLLSVNQPPTSRLKFPYYYYCTRRRKQVLLFLFFLVST